MARGPEQEANRAEARRLPPLVSSQFDVIQSQHQAAVCLAEQSELHAVLAGMALLALRRGLSPREWRGWVTKAQIPRTTIAKYILKAEALEVTAYLAK